MKHKKQTKREKELIEWLDWYFVTLSALEQERKDACE